MICSECLEEDETVTKEGGMCSLCREHFDTEVEYHDLLEREGAESNAALDEVE